MNDKKEGGITLKSVLPVDDIVVFSKMIKELKSKNRYFLSEHSTKLLENLVNYVNLFKNHRLVKGDKTYRARINDCGKNNDYPPFPLNKMGAPPTPNATHGRINPVGISYLYLASDLKTAVAEVRPWKGCEITVAEFYLKKEIKLANFSNKVAINKPSDSKYDGAEWTWSELITYYFSMPIDPRDDISYIPIQYISERIKKEGFDGIMYDSALDKDGYNICLFNPPKASPKKRFSVSVTDISHEMKTNEC